MLLLLFVICHLSFSISFAQTTPDSARIEAQQDFNVLFMAEPGDTLTFTEAEDTLAFEPDTMKLITVKDIYDSLDFRNFIPGTPYELIADRISCLSTTMPLTYNRTVNSFINFFTVRKRNYTQTIIERAPYYFPMFEEMLAKYGLPDELKYLSIVESALNTRALSKSGAVGLWQFMSGTGRDLNLHQDKYIDDRMEPRKATEAACKYLKFLYGAFNDWELALAAYNCGPGAIRRVMNRTGGRTFWEIYPNLPAETRSYVPQFTAVVYTMNYHREHNLFPDIDSMLTVPELDTVVLDRQINLANLARHLEINPHKLSFINPSLRKPISPEKLPYTLRLPAEAARRFRLERTCFLDSCIAMPLPDFEELAYRRPHRGKSVKASVIALGITLKKHTVRRGESVYGIADKYNVAVSDIKKASHLRSLRLKAGQHLLIPIKAKHDAKHVAARLPSTSNSKPTDDSTSIQDTAKQTVVAKSTVKTRGGKPLNADKKGNVKPAASLERAIAKPTQESEELMPIPATKGDDGKLYYEVQPGDTLWSLSRRYQGMTIQKLIKLNDLKDKTLKVGQKLIVG